MNTHNTHNTNDDTFKSTEKAILVGCLLPHQSAKQVESSLHELSLLAETAQAEPLDTVVQKRERIDSAYYIGKGKANELAQSVEQMGADVVIFNDELSPSQTHNLERLLSCKVIDRTQLILHIFAMRARTKEGQLQVELAQLRYLLPRIVGLGTSLSRLGGGIGTRGPGETKLETDRRHIRRRMSDIEHQLQKIVFHRKRYRERRHKNNMLQIALVGYTNAGKSTLLNRLTSASTLTEDQLFATLDPTTKQLQLPSGMPVLITDTVGFIQNLPTTLVAAFRSTLEEVKEADLLLHVIDSTDENFDVYMGVVHRLLAELDAAHIPAIHVYNKKDRVPADGLVVHEEDLYISAFHEHDLQRVKDTIDRHFRSRMECEKLRIPVSSAPRLLARIRRQGWIERLNWSADGDYYEVEAFLWPHHSLEKEIDPFRL